MGIFSKKPNAGRIHATKAGRFLADVQREAQKDRDELARRRNERKNGKQS